MWQTTIIWMYIMITINVQITCELVSFNVWKLTWRSSCKSQNTLWYVENGKTTTTGRFFLHCIMGILLELFIVFLRNSCTNHSWNLGIPYFRTFPWYLPLIYVTSMNQFVLKILIIVISNWFIIFSNFLKMYLVSLQLTGYNKLK